ncbi:hypothetical protein F4824DRAFT_20498 [Ustulina deusta]|nr:hypothetical protein F4824DRAFT_20498 [Ustulina deusta]
MPPPYIVSPSQRRSLFQLMDRVLEIATENNSHTVHSPPRLKDTSGDGWGQNNELDKPLEWWEIVVTALGCLIGAAVSSWILYCCWKHCGPRPTYYETAMRSHKKGVIYQCMEMGHYPQNPSSRIASTPCIDPVVVIVDDELARPDAAKTRSSSCYDE